MRGKTGKRVRWICFPLGQVEEPLTEITYCEEYPLNELLRYEYETLGFYLSSHPLKAYEDILERVFGGSPD